MGPGGGWYEHPDFPGWAIAECLRATRLDSRTGEYRWVREYRAWDCLRFVHGRWVAEVTERRTISDAAVWIEQAQGV